MSLKCGLPDAVGRADAVGRDGANLDLGVKVFLQVGFHLSDPQRITNEVA